MELKVYEDLSYQVHFYNEDDDELTSLKVFYEKKLIIYSKCKYFDHLEATCMMGEKLRQWDD